MISASGVKRGNCCSTILSRLWAMRNMLACTDWEAAGLVAELSAVLVSCCSDACAVRRLSPLTTHCQYGITCLGTHLLITHKVFLSEAQWFAEEIHHKERSNKVTQLANLPPYGPFVTQDLLIASSRILWNSSSFHLSSLLINIWRWFVSNCKVLIGTYFGALGSTIRVRWEETTAIKKEIRFLTKGKNSEHEKKVLVLLPHCDHLLQLHLIFWFDPVIFKTLKNRRHGFDRLRRVVITIG